MQPARAQDVDEAMFYSEGLRFNWQKCSQDRLQIATMAPITPADGESIISARTFVVDVSDANGNCPGYWEGGKDSAGKDTDDGKLCDAARNKLNSTMLTTPLPFASYDLLACIFPYTKKRGYNGEHYACLAQKLYATVAIWPCPYACLYILQALETLAVSMAGRLCT